jgi:hypothetical protein
MPPIFWHKLYEEVVQLADGSKKKDPQRMHELIGESPASLRKIDTHARHLLGEERGKIVHQDPVKGRYTYACDYFRIIAWRATLQIVRRLPEALTRTAVRESRRRNAPPSASSAITSIAAEAMR